MSVHHAKTGPIRPGYRVTITYVDPGTQVRISVENDEIVSTVPIEVTVEPLVQVPTHPGAVVFPHDPGAHAAYFLDEDGRWRFPGSASEFGETHVRQALAGKTHYVAFKGIER